ncbi:MAG: Alpha/beta hydrolase family protein [Actinobacteria bacterium ADurb.Bin346]|nr:MAG: Alpha/beta hydrolase family protein [Actinobacteria bacterium ADurb.Bin346]
MTELYSYKSSPDIRKEIFESDFSDTLNLSGGLPEKLKRSSKLFTIKYPSPFITSVEENDTVYSELFINSIKSSGLIILLHGFSSSPTKLANYYRFIDAALENGFSCAFLNMPYHLNRTPANEKSGERLIYFDDVQTLKFYHQAVVDIRRLTDILKENFNFKKIFLCGFSMGSMLSIITTAIDNRIDKAALIFGGGNWFEIHWNSMLAYVLRGNCIRDGIITKDKCREIYTAFPSFLKEFKSADISSIGLEHCDSISLRDKIVKKCFLCDPLAFAHRLDRHKVIMLGSRLDHFFSKKSLLQVWEEAGRPELHWFFELHTSFILNNKHARKLIFGFYQR